MQKIFPDTGSTLIKIHLLWMAMCSSKQQNN